MSRKAEPAPPLIFCDRCERVSTHLQDPVERSRHGWTYRLVISTLEVGESTETFRFEINTCPRCIP